MAKKENRLVLCVVGQPGSGKDTLANFLEKERNFAHISTGNIIREEMTKLGIPTNRENMRKFSQKKRGEVGNSYPVNIVARKIVDNTVVSGSRNLAEVDFLRNKFGKSFMLVAVDAPITVRYERVKNGRGRTGDGISFEEFKAQEKAEYNSNAHEVGKLLSMADCSIDNSGTEDKMFDEMDRVLEFMGK